MPNRLVWPLTLLPLMTACAAPTSPGPRPVPMPAAHAEIHRRTRQVFQHALFCKPAAGGTAESLVAEPLFAIENTPDSPAAHHAPRVLYFEQSMATVGARALRQITYYWSVSVASADGPMEGLRTTYREDGVPIIYERFREAGGSTVLFVSAGHERDAQKAHGVPLPGRMFAVERSLEKQPGTVVAGLVQEGPMVLGPWIYIAADGEVTTLLCRCSPSQVEHEAPGQYYDTQPADPPWRNEPYDWRDPCRLERMLRWPQ